MEILSSSIGLFLLLLVLASPVFIAVEALFGRKGILNRAKNPEETALVESESDFTPGWRYCPRCGRDLEGRWRHCPDCQKRTSEKATQPE